MQVATPSDANDVATKDYVDKLSLTLIEKRIITTTGQVDIPEETKLITYIGIGGGGGGGSSGKGAGLMILGGNGGGGGSGAAGNATPGKYGSYSPGSGGSSVPGTNGGNGGNGESGIIWNVKSLKVTSHIGAGGIPGFAGTNAGANGGDTYVTAESTEELVTHIKNVSPNVVSGNAGGPGVLNGIGGKAVAIFGIDNEAGQGGNGGIGTTNINPSPGTKGNDGAIIMFFYK